ncbi:hypothetical protein [Photorhabdus namnaonensis]|uniref:Uncharacterized protein n=1 Tax=Photorhabdus namnaonensis TaxID=1851568 RepID=A0A1B8YFV8_9GAMM|nr:hypothetical protein [Photorhabdus namnaonensis]OCA53957.1 hypothetical protein Phpb_03061 [Photorhabdus namnaonensis]
MGTQHGKASPTYIFSKKSPEIMLHTGTDIKTMWLKDSGKYFKLFHATTLIFVMKSSN